MIRCAGWRTGRCAQVRIVLVSLLFAACGGSRSNAGAELSRVAPLSSQSQQDPCVALREQEEEVAGLLGQGHLLRADRRATGLSERCLDPGVATALGEARAKLQTLGDADATVRDAIAARDRGDAKASRELFDIAASQMQKSGSAPRLELPENFEPAAKTKFLAGNKRVASIAGSVVVLVDPATGTRELLRGAREPLINFAASNDGQWLAAVSEREVFVWNVARLELVATIPAAMEEASYNRLIEFAPNGKTLIFHSDSFLMLWDVEHQRMRAVIPDAAPTGLERKLDFLGRGSLVVSANFDLVVADLVSGVVVTRFAVGRSDSNEPEYAVSSDGTMLAVEGRSNDMTRSWLTLWNATQRRTLHRKLESDRCQRFSFGAPAFVPDGSKLLVPGPPQHNQASICIFDVARGALSTVRTVVEEPNPNRDLLAIDERSFLTEVASTRDGRAAIAFSPGGAHLVELATGRIFPRPFHFIGALPDGSTLARDYWEHDAMRIASNTASVPFGKLKDDLYELFNTSAGTVLLSYNSTPQWIREVDTGRVINLQTCSYASFYPFVASSDGSLLATGGNTGRPCLWNTKDGHLVTPTLAPLPYAQKPSALSFNANGLLVALDDGSLRRIDLASGRATRLISAKPGVVSVDFIAASDGKVREAVRDNDGALLLDSNGSSLKVQVPNDRLMLSPDGRWLVAAQFFHDVTVLDTSTGAPIRVIKKAELDWQGPFAIQPHGAVLAVGGRNDVTLWDLRTGSSLGKLNCGGYSGVAFDAAGMQLATAGGQEVVLWDVTTGKAKAILASARNGLDYRNPVFGGPWLAAHNGGRVDVWNLPSLIDAATVTATPKRPTLSVELSQRDAQSAMALSPDGKLLAVAREPSAITLYALPEGRELFTTQFRGGPSGDALTTIAPSGLVEIAEEARDVLTLSQCGRQGKNVPFELCDGLWLEGNLWARQMRSQ